MPRFLERDEAIRRAPRPPYAWDGVGDVRPFGALEKTIVEGVLSRYMKGVMAEGGNVEAFRSQIGALARAAAELASSDSLR